jgi:hypothetical protein
VPSLCQSQVLPRLRGDERRLPWLNGATADACARCDTRLRAAPMSLERSAISRGKAAEGRRLHRLEPDPVTAPVVTGIFNEYVAGRGMASIARGLNQDGIAGGLLLGGHGRIGPGTPKEHSDGASACSRVPWARPSP